MKALTERQPYASLIAAGVKTIVTRARPVAYRGRVAIHAAKRPLTASEVPITRAEKHVAEDYPEIADALGAVVASAVITDCWEVTGKSGEGWAAGQGRPLLSNGHTVPDTQYPFDDFSSGRWALLLDDIAPTTARCPQCWGDPVYHGLGCDLCTGKGTCDPVPARGRSGLWEWTR